MDASSDAVPPTTHEIPHTDRQRMMRSMRKITAVLGETPVVEAASPAPHLLAPNSGKHGFFFHASASLSSLVLPMKKSDRAQTPEPRPSLVLRVPETSKFTPLPSPLSPSFSPTLISPTSPQEDQDRRRLCLSKVSRTLGETVPPELIFTEPAVKRRRRASTLILPESALEHQTFAELAGGLVAGEPRSTRRPLLGGAKAIRRAMSFILPTEAPDILDTDVDMDALGEVHVHPVTSFSPDRLSPAEGEWLRPVSTAVFATSTDFLATSTPDEPVEFARGGPPPSTTVFPMPATDREPTPFASLGLGAPPTYEESHEHGPRSDSRLSYLIPHPSGSQPGSMERHEEEWSGEWVGGAAENMDDVMRRLRGLKVK
ncbi:hypothetical protein K438DRAFT_1965117 [Mycena galopus ATCC 62051]|nr:hypothetical protein K438DRAFT_1965117 [Mycena galopus ATCC 62051]